MLRKIFKEIGQKFKRKNAHILNSMAGKQGELSHKINSVSNVEDIFNGVKIIRSNKRKKTISARLAGDVMVVYAPVDISDSELEKIIDKLKKKLDKQKFKTELNKTQDLAVIAERLNKEYFNSSLKISSIEYTTNQSRLFGCCNYRTKKIRISHRLAQAPYWVRDYVIIHEMAHLIEPNHSKAFWDIVSRYKLTERARGYLIAKGLDSDLHHKGNDMDAGNLGS
ncbi:MAG: M48 family metallopeptidase [Candidatus Omnitrophota bacterium]